MPNFYRASTRLARTSLLCLVALVWIHPASAEDIPGWRQAKDLSGLVTHLDRWLDDNTDLPRRDVPLRIRLVSRAKAAALAGTHHAAFVETLRGLYDADQQTIWLITPWSPRDPRDVSVLLHELVHHRQDTARHWYCPQAQEPAAYGIQETWLASLGLTLDYNRISVTLAAGCTPRDIHPD